MIAEYEITRLDISIYYEFHDKLLSTDFIIDFSNKKAYWSPELYESEYGIMNKKVGNDEIHSMLYNQISKEVYVLKDNSINDFIARIREIGFIKQLYDCEEDLIKGFNHVNSEERMMRDLNSIELNKTCYITLYASDCSDKLTINLDIQKSWNEFALALKKLVGIDVLNIDNEKYWINSLNYELRNDGVYHTNDGIKLEIKTFKFNYRSLLHFPSKFVLDFMNNELIMDGDGYYNDLVNKFLEGSSGIEILEERGNETIVLDENRNVLIVDWQHIQRKISATDMDKFMECLVKHNVFLWSDKYSWSNFEYNSDNIIICDGYTWYIEIEFMNGAIYHVGHMNGHPDTYFEFGEDLKKIFGNDLLFMKGYIPLNTINE